MFALQPLFGPERGR